MHALPSLAGSSGIGRRPRCKRPRPDPRLTVLTAKPDATTSRALPECQQQVPTANHAAEALLRLACVRLAPKPGTRPRCLWAEMATGPRSIEDVVTRLNNSANAPNPSERMLRVVIPPGALEATSRNAEIIDAVSVYVGWLVYALDLLGPAQVDVQAANNKAKHGLAVRARSDVRVTFVSQQPNDDGSVPLSAFTGDGVIDIFDQPVLESLAPEGRCHRQGLELTQLRLKPSAILAEAFMLAMTHAGMFHVAAEHFAGRDDGVRHRLPSCYRWAKTATVRAGTVNCPVSALCVAVLTTGSFPLACTECRS